MPSIEDYAPDGGNAPIDNPDKGSPNKAMVIPKQDGPLDPNDTMLKRPSIYVFPEDAYDDMEDLASKVIAQGPWVSLCTNFGWVAGELVGEVDDAMTIRRVHSMEDDGPIYYDLGIKLKDVLTWSTLEGDRWAHPEDDEPAYGIENLPKSTHDPLTGFPLRGKS